MKRWALAGAGATLALVLGGCATTSTTVLVDRQITEPRVVALAAPRLPWVVEIETRLRQRGFQVRRWASQRYVRQQVTPERTEEFRQAATRYVLVIEGSAPLDWWHRCIAGGYNFDWLTVELVDVRTNETIISTSGSGYSEGCAPLSGTIFSDIVSAVERAWQAPGPPPGEGAR